MSMKYGVSQMKDWAYLTKMTGDESFTVTQVKLDSNGIAINGEFELPPLAQLLFDDQVFVAAFVKCHGSIKQMEKHFGVSYPTIKSRLNKIAGKLDFVDIQISSGLIDRSEILDQIEQGELSVNEAINLIKKGDKNE